MVLNKDSLRYLTTRSIDDRASNVNEISVIFTKLRDEVILGTTDNVKDSIGIQKANIACPKISHPSILVSMGVVLIRCWFDEAFADTLALDPYSAFPPSWYRTL